MSQLFRSESPPSLSAKQGGSKTRGFSIRYDVESAVENIDIGGIDQAVRSERRCQGLTNVCLTDFRRMAEFVTRAIDNVAHGLSVQLAMDNLGLKE